MRDHPKEHRCWTPSASSRPAGVPRHSAQAGAPRCTTPASGWGVSPVGRCCGHCASRRAYVRRRCHALAAPLAAPATESARAEQSATVQRPWQQARQTPAAATGFSTTAAATGAVHARWRARGRRWRTVRCRGCRLGRLFSFSSLLLSLFCCRQCFFGLLQQLRLLCVLLLLPLEVCPRCDKLLPASLFLLLVGLLLRPCHCLVKKPCSNSASRSACRKYPP